MTPWERKLWYEFLRDYPLRFQRQKAIGNYIVDFYCAKTGLVIELDGRQHYTQKGIENDGIRTEFLKKQGLRVLRISNYKIRECFKSTCESIDLLVYACIEPKEP